MTSPLSETELRELASRICSWTEAWQDDEMIDYCQRCMEGVSSEEEAWERWFLAMQEHGRQIGTLAAGWKAGVLELLPSSAPKFVAAGLAAVDEGDFDDAHAAFRVAASLDPASTGAVEALKRLESQLTTLFEPAGDDEEAPVPDLVGKWLDLGVSYGEAAHYELAEQAFRAALEIHPEASRIHASLGVSIACQDREEEAEEHFRRAVELDPTDAYAYMQLGNNMGNQGRHEEAVEAFKTAAKLDEDDPRAWGSLGRALFELDEIQAALEPLGRAVDLAPMWLEPWQYLGAALLGCDQPEAAEEVLQQATEAHPGAGDLWVDLGIAVGSQGRHDEATECFERALDLDPQDAIAMANLSYNELCQGNHDESERLARAAVEAAGDLAAPHIQLGEVLAARGDLEGAREAYRKAAELDPEDEMAKEGLEKLGG